jgi:geranylgeranyl diphosphate synthase type II
MPERTQAKRPEVGDAAPKAIDATTASARLAAFAQRFDARLAELLPPPDDTRLVEAMRYSLLAPGKRLRPYLVDCCCRLVGGDFEAAVPAGAALEMVHAFSLIHDDLPAMDDDDLRRGRPTNHKVFGEATAILAGDALLALAFETLATRVSDPARATALVAELARATGACGMISGQAADLAGEHLEPQLERVRSVHERKTAALLAAACRMGALAGGGSSEQVSGLGEFGRRVGLAFQIVDDVLDETSTAAELGKAVRKDQRRRKQTYPASVGIEQSRIRAAELANEALEWLAGFGSQAEELADVARFVLARAS